MCVCYHVAVVHLCRDVFTCWCVTFDVCLSPQIKGYPTLKVVFQGDEVKPYRGSRDFDSLKTFIETTAKELAKEL